MKQGLLGRTRPELSKILQSMGQPAFRAKQLENWLFSLVPFAQMSNLPAALRQQLAQEYSEGYGAVHTRLVSKDGTRKYLYELEDKSLIESVLMEYEHGRTVCISTQAGCAMGCAFCASCIGGLIRNLTAGEMLFQVLAANRDAGGGRSVTNIVLMGTGEPLANYENVMAFLRAIHSEESLGVSYRNISLSTCGLVPKIRQFTKEGLPVTLCLSLHAPTEEKRKALMPIAKRYTIPETLGAMREYIETSGRRGIIEYILIDGFNNGPEDAKTLADLLKPGGFHVNLIPYNGASGPFKSPGRAGAEAFAKRLQDLNLSATVRRALGADIAGACGQLRAAAGKI